MKIQQTTITQLTQHQTGVESIDPGKEAQVRVLDAGVAVGVQQNSELLIAHFNLAQTRDKLSISLGQGGRIPKRNGNALPADLDLWFGEKGVLHLGKHARYSFALLPGNSQVNQDTHQARIAAPVNPFE